MQLAGLISYRWGKIQVLDRPATAIRGSTKRAKQERKEIRMSRKPRFLEAESLRNTATACALSCALWDIASISGSMSRHPELPLGDHARLLRLAIGWLAVRQTSPHFRHPNKMRCQGRVRGFSRKLLAVCLHAETRQCIFFRMIGIVFFRMIGIVHSAPQILKHKYPMAP